MSRVNLEGVSVHIPVYDANTLRLLRMPKFGRATRARALSFTRSATSTLRSMKATGSASSATTAPARPHCCG
jgi:hypothetical protein